MGHRQKVEFVAKIEEIQKELMAYIQHLLWDKKQYEDVLQDVLTTAYQKFSTFEEKNFRCWIFKIATYTTFNHNRRCSRESKKAENRVLDRLKNLDIIENIETEIAYDTLLESPEIILEQLEDHVHKAIYKLSEKERSVFLLRTFADISYREIAEVLEMPVGSVMGFLARARTKLRQHLGEYARAQGYGLL